MEGGHQTGVASGCPPFMHSEIWTFDLTFPLKECFLLLLFLNPTLIACCMNSPGPPTSTTPTGVCSFKDVRYKLANGWQVFLSRLWLLLPAVSRYFTFRSCLIDFNSIMSPVADHKCFHGQRHWFTLIMMSVELATRSQNFALQLICFTV